MGEDEKMLNEHDKIINDNIIPRLNTLEQGQLTLEQGQIALEQGQIALRQSQEANQLQLSAFKMELESFRLSQQDLKNTVVESGSTLKEQNRELLKHVLKMDETKHKTSEKLTLKRLGTKEKVWLSILGGGGLVSGLIGLGVAIWGG
jgi:Holliday junction resolvasome RuvABC endonuclease subunit